MTPYYSDDDVVLYHGDCRDVMAMLGYPIHVIVTDPPYSETSLGWDVCADGWVSVATDRTSVRTIWCWGSLRSLLNVTPELRSHGWTLAQEIVWEKHNGSGFARDRFRRVHEFAAHFYRGAWVEQLTSVPTVPGVGRKVVTRRRGPAHTGEVGVSRYESDDGAPRLMRSVLRVRSEHGRALHPTQKPLGVLVPLIEYSTEHGDWVLDPFAGSGSTAVAARQLGRKAILIEKEERYCEVIVDRLRQQELFGGAA